MDPFLTVFEILSKLDKRHAIKAISRNSLRTGLSIMSEFS